MIAPSWPTVSEYSTSRSTSQPLVALSDVTITSCCPALVCRLSARIDESAFSPPCSSTTRSCLTHFSVESE